MGILRIVKDIILNNKNRKREQDMAIQLAALISIKWGSSKTKKLQNFNNYDKSRRRSKLKK